LSINLGCLLVFDLTKRKSFEGLEKWVEELKQFAPEELTILLVGNKLDLADEREITFQEADDFAHKYHFDYIEVSAKTAMNISFMFDIISKSLIERYNESIQKRKTKKKNSHKEFKKLDKIRYTEEKSGCCS
jgi:GTPase SAR1 family protein